VRPVRSIAPDGMNPDPQAASPRRSELENRRRSQQLFLLGLGGLALALGYYGFTAKVSDPFHLYEGLLIFILAVLPSLLWARRGGKQLPVFEVQMITGVSTFALPLLNSHEQMSQYSAEVIGSAAQLILLYQVVAIGTHALIGGQPGRSNFYTQPVLSHGVQKFLSAGLVLSTVYTFINVFYEGLIPYELNSICRAGFAGVGLISTFIEMRRWGLGQLKYGEAGFITLLLAAQVIMQISTLFLTAGMAILLLALLGYVSGSKRIPLVPVAVALVLLGVLHNGKSVMRERFWDADGVHRQVEFTNLVSFYSDWVAEGLTVHEESEEKKKSTAKLLDRSSLIQILCLVVSQTPDRRPYLDGATYALIPGQFIPRYFWPDKPPGHVATNMLSVYYGLQDENATKSTTIGFGFVAEAYANFGLFGVGVIACLLGACYKKIQVLTANAELFSYAGLFLVVLMAWSFQTEFTMAIWISSFYQACVAVMGIPFLLRNLTG
jgi:hypothetical protein